MVVKAVGNRYVTYLNGLKAADLVDEQPFSDRLAGDVLKPPLREGVIALQLHSGGGAKVRWKDLFVKEMSSEEKPK